MSEGQSAAKDCVLYNLAWSRFRDYNGSSLLFWGEMV